MQTYVPNIEDQTREFEDLAKDVTDIHLAMISITQILDHQSHQVTQISSLTHQAGVETSAGVTHLVKGAKLHQNYLHRTLGMIATGLVIAVAIFR